jgi:hypothetical protein
MPEGWPPGRAERTWHTQRIDGVEHGVEQHQALVSIIAFSCDANLRAVR